MKSRACHCPSTSRAVRKDSEGKEKDPDLARKLDHSGNIRSRTLPYKDRLEK